MDLVEFWERDVLPHLRVDDVYEGVSWQQRGPRFWRGPCPLHGGKNPNFSVDAHTLRWRCFSQCGGGSLFSYLNAGSEPTGADWVDKLRALARFAGASFPEQGTPETVARAEETTRRQTLLEAVAVMAQNALFSPESADADKVRKYLTERGFDSKTWPDMPFGLVERHEVTKHKLLKRGFTIDEIKASGVLRDDRFENRLLIIWRDVRGRIGTLVARDLNADAADKYLYLSRDKGFARSKSELVAFGLDGALPAIRKTGELVLVEGLLDALTLQQHGFTGVAAIGGHGREMSTERLMALRQLGVRRLIICLDNDLKNDGTWPGRDGLRHIAQLATMPKNVRNVDNGNVLDKGNVADVVYNIPVVDIVPPFLLGRSKDADAYVRTRGIGEFRELLEECESAARFLADDVCGAITSAAPSAARRGAIERVLELDAGFSSLRAPLDREEVRALAAQRTGFSLESIAQIGEEMTRQSARQQRKRALETWLRSAAREVAQTDTGSEVGEGVFDTLIARWTTDLSYQRATAKAMPAPFSVIRLDEESRRQPEGKVSGWPSLDNLGVRFGPGEMALIAARTGHGKTSFLVALLAQWLCESSDEPLLFFSLEEPELRIYQRLLALLAAQEAVRTESKSSIWTVPQVRDFGRDPAARGPEFGWPDPRLLESARNLLRRAEGRLQIIHQSDWTLDDIEAYTRSQAAHRPVSAVFVDYLQRVPLPGRFDRRDQEVSAIGRRLKTLAGDVAAPVIAGAQINREAIPESYGRQMNTAKTYSEAQKVIRAARPELHHLREGGSEQEADLALGLLSYGADYRGEVAAPPGTRLEIGTLKNRNGEPGKWASLVFEGRSGLVREAKPSEDY
jgi:DNA primase catalytic core